MSGRRRAVVRAALAVMALVAADRAIGLLPGQLDLTAERSLTLSDETRRVVDAVDGRVQIVAFLPRVDPARAPGAALLTRYSRLDRRITVRLADPDQAPGEARRLGVDPVLGGVAVTARGRTEVAPTVTEQDVTAALARVLRGRQPGVCVTVGHGETDPHVTTQDGGAALLGALVANGYRVRTLDLFVRPAVPADCDAVLVAGPDTELSDEAAAAMRRWLDRSGRALVLADPSAPATLSPVLDPFGVAVEKGLVVEGDADARLGDDPFTPVVRRFASANPAVRRLPPVVLPGAQGLRLAPDAGGRSTTPLARTSPLSYLERRPEEPRFDPADDLQGPVVVAAAADRSRVEDGEVVRSRLVVVGDADLATNAFVGEGGNGRLLVQAMDWLTLDEDLVSVSANIPAFRPLALTAGRLRYARLLMAGVVPALFLLAGALVWAVRRGR